MALPDKIDSFSGEYAFLSNFYPAPLDFETIVFLTSEHAFQAAKSIHPEDWFAIAACDTPGKAKRMGRKIQRLRVGWDFIKLEIMEEVLRAKFEQHPDLMQKLINTGNAQLIEGNNWGDHYWGKVNGFGSNHLGLLLMKIRNQR